MLFDAPQLLMLLQWTDSAFPTGSFAHSGGLETYTQAELITTSAELAALIAVKLDAASWTDMIVVHTVMSAAAEGDWQSVADCDALCSASKVAKESREASEKVGRRLLASVRNVIGASSDETSPPTPLHKSGELIASADRESGDGRDVLRPYVDGLAWFHDAITSGKCAGHHAVAHGLACAALGIKARPALLAFAYALAANQTAAALKLISIGQTQAQAVLGAAGVAMTAAADSALARTLDDFGAFTPGLDIRAMQHEHLFRRLFIS